MSHQHDVLTGFLCLIISWNSAAVFADRSGCLIPPITNGKIQHGSSQLAVFSYINLGSLVEIKCDSGFIPNIPNDDGRRACVESFDWFPSIPSRYCVAGQATTTQQSALDVQQQQLSNAAATGNTDQVRQLLSAGNLKVDWRDGKQHGDCFDYVTNGTALLRAVQCNQTVEMATLLINNGAEINATEDYNGNQPLHFAAGQGNLRVVTLLVNKGANVNVENNIKQRPLAVAATNGHSQVVNFLLDHGAQVNAVDMMGGTALMSAASNGLVDIVSTLLAKGADVSLKQNVTGWTALTSAAMNGNVEVVQMLIDKGADLNVKLQTGVDGMFSPLKAGYNLVQIAAASRNPSAAKLLADKGAPHDNCVNSDPAFNNNCP